MKECSLCGRCLADHHAVCPDDRAALLPVFDGPPVLDRKYRLLGRLGAGGMGAVYRAHHGGLDREVAVKLLHPARQGEPGAQERFQVEARALARLDHPNVVKVADFGFDETRELPYLVLELLDALPFSEHLRRAGPLPLSEALSILSQVAAALDHAHAEGILHRDLKASNVLLLQSPAGERVAKIVDFGLASFVSDTAATPPLDLGKAGTPDEVTAATAGPLLGTPTYLAPELWEGEPPSEASDLWAFGVLAFLTLTGKLPFPGIEAAAIRAQIARGAPRPSAIRTDLDPALDAAILAPLEPDPAARPAHVREVVAGIERALLRVERRRWWRREGPRRLALAALLGALGTAALLPLTPLLQPLEGPLVDARFLLASPRPARPEPLLVLIDDATLASDPDHSLAAKADEVGRLLERAFAAGARGAAIDLLPPKPWGGSAAFMDLVLRHPDRLALAAYSPVNGPVVGPEAIGGLTAAALGPERARELFGFVDVEEDGDGVVRRAWPLFRDVAGQLRPSFAARAAHLVNPATPLSEGAIWIDGAVDWRGFERLSFRDLPDALDRDPGRFRNRLVLLGADYAASGDDHYRIPHSGALPPTLSGPVLQTLILQTILDGAPVRSPGRAALLLALALLATAVAAAILLWRRSLAVTASALAAVAWIAIAFALFAARRLLVPVAPPLAALLLVVGLAAALRKWLTPFPHLLFGVKLEDVQPPPPHPASRPPVPRSAARGSRP